MSITVGCKISKGEKRWWGGGRWGREKEKKRKGKKT